MHRACASSREGANRPAWNSAWKLRRRGVARQFGHAKSGGPAVSGMLQDAQIIRPNPGGYAYCFARAAITAWNSAMVSSITCLTGLIESMRPATWPLSAIEASMSPPK